ncbi:MAG TPA: hypothetical protein VNU26_04485, partial [Mycobacteriales bacterium]|nr:hypothetical protein [Mycobacteriales bacterium]
MVAEAPSIETPLGQLLLRLRCGDISTDEASRDTDDGRRRWIWSDVGGVRVELLVTPFPWPADGATGRLSGSVGAVWRWTALRDTEYVTIEATMPGHGSPNNGECLEALEFESSDWVLDVGGPDDDCLGR